MIVVNNDGSQSEGAKEHNKEPDNNPIKNDSDVIEPKRDKKEVDQPVPDHHWAVNSKEHKGERMLKVFLSKEEVDIDKGNEDQMKEVEFAYDSLQ